MRIQAPAGTRQLPRTVWALGLVSLCMDASSELVHSLLPLYLALGLHTSVAMIGFLEGLAEATAQVVKVFSGTLSDRLGRRKGLTVFGYGLAALSKPVFPLAPDLSWVFTARLADRVGKGIRGAPRDALIADVTPPALRGTAFGLRQALDSVGAFLGPVAAIVLMTLCAGDFRTVLWFAVVPAVLAMGFLVWGVDEPPRAHPALPPVGPWFASAALGRACWNVVALGAVFTLARFSEAFLVLLANERGLAAAHAPAVLIALGVVYAAVSYPAGVLGDRTGPRGLLATGLVVLGVADVVLALAATPAQVLLGAGLWGAHLGLTQGLLNKLVADTAPAALRGTAFGVFNLATGIALGLASMLAGLAWATRGAAATFLLGALFAALALAGTLLVGSEGGGAQAARRGD